ncbi:DUF2663 family protein [Paenibacillus allorhizosphaerae]|uniref:DUF2663 family protein n=1 Tax=Paenibacillus allorhizosphaerae TaxID=2849866 RepID=A0ABN7TN28_9BACL|nr:DUF2663 family protein [Paenibacillus allorhizosphaerae]CAG7642348.1 hypothetical protein PAECIP111802_02847 [Paenibacillus allorhizosphaerae]
MAWIDMNVSEDVQAIMRELIARKQKLDRYKRLKIGFAWAAVCLFLFFSYYFYNYVLVPSQKNMITILASFGNNKLLFSMLLGLISSYYLMNYFTTQYDKQKTKYDLLRAEMIDYFMFPRTASKHAAMREAISKQLKEKHDINISFKS